MLDKERSRDIEIGQKQRRNKAARYDESWCPPPFEESGASYVLDVRSGMFYEQHSDFFYDPKSKLYYSNKQKAYFSFHKEKPRFRRVGNMTNSDSKITNELSTNNLPDTESTNQTELSCEHKAPMASTQKANTGSDNCVSNFGSKNVKKNLVTISIGTKSRDSKGKHARVESESLGSGSKKSLDHVLNSSRSVNSSADKKKHSADMEKWSLRCRSESESNPVVKKKEDGKGVLVPVNSNKCVQEPAAGKGPLSTAGGKPICLICKRKFASLEKLALHEKMSSLHKENLAKKMLLCKGNKEASAEYRDRAKDRRYLYGPDTSSVTKAIDNKATEHLSSLSVSKARLVTTTETVAPHENLGNNNIGNQMLQKLGWNGGDLGRKNSTGTKDASEVISASSKLKEEWETIEKMAAAKPGQRSVSRKIGC